MLLEESTGPLQSIQRELAVTARDETERLQSTVNELLDLVRIEREAGALKLAPVNACALLHEVGGDLSELDGHRSALLCCRGEHPAGSGEGQENVLFKEREIGVGASPPSAGLGDIDRRWMRDAQAAAVGLPDTPGAIRRGEARWHADGSRADQVGNEHSIPSRGAWPTS